MVWLSHRENAGEKVGMVPFIINPIYTLYSGYLLGISLLFRASWGGLNSQGTIPRVPPFSLWFRWCSFSIGKKSQVTAVQRFGVYCELNCLNKVCQIFGIPKLVDRLCDRSASPILRFFVSWLMFDMFMKCHRYHQDVSGMNKVELFSIPRYVPEIDVFRLSSQYRTFTPLKTEKLQWKKNNQHFADVEALWQAVIRCNWNWAPEEESI